jgi:hypothetical protein
MTNYQRRACTCGSGSGLLSFWRYDARGIELCRTCDKCHDKQMAKYRPEVLTDPDYWHEEPIDD